MARNLLRNHMLNFGNVIEGLKLGKKFIRSGWNGKDMFIALQTPDEGSANTLPYIYIVTQRPATPNDKPVRVPWLASQTDMLSEDWSEVA